MVVKKKSSKSSDKLLRENVVELLNGRGAHAGFDDIVKDMPRACAALSLMGCLTRRGCCWKHLRLAQWDILEFSRNPKYKSPKWPEGYCLRRRLRECRRMDKSIRQFRKDLKNMQELVENPKTDLYAGIPWGNGQTILREALAFGRPQLSPLGPTHRRSPSVGSLER